MTGVRVSNRRIYGSRPSGFGVYSGPVYSDITNNKKKNMFPEEKPEGFDNMTDAQRREYFKQHVF